MLTSASPAAHGGDDHDGVAIVEWCRQSGSESNALLADEDVHVLAHLTLLGDDAIEHGGPASPQLCEGVRHGAAVRLELERAAPSRVGEKRPRKHHRDRHADQACAPLRPTTNALTQVMEGSASAMEA